MSQVSISFRGIVLIDQALGELARSPTPVKTSKKLVKTMKVVNEITRDFQQQRQNILASLMVDGKIPEDKRSEFESQIEALWSTERTVEIEQIDIDELGDICLSPASLHALSFLFVS